MEIEQQVKAGAEKLLQNYASHGPRHLQDEAKRALEESRDKIGIITNQLSRLHKELQVLGEKQAVGGQGFRNGAGTGGPARFDSPAAASELGENCVETRVAELKQRLLVERAVLNGATNAVKLMKGNKQADKSAKQKVRPVTFCSASSVPPANATVCVALGEALSAVKA